jgi:hypothetical protein
MLIKTKMVKPNRSGRKTLIALSAAIALCTLGAAAAQAHGGKAKWYPGDDDPGPPIPTIHYGTSWGNPTFGGNAYGFVPPANHAHHNSKERIRGR